MWAIQGLSVPLAGVRKPDAQALGVFLPFPRWGAGGNTDQKEKTRARHAGFRTLFKHPVKPPGAGQQESGAHRRTQRCAWPANWPLPDGHLVTPGCGNGREPPRARVPVEVCPCVLSKCEAVSVVTWKHLEQAHVHSCRARGTKHLEKAKPRSFDL